METNTLDRVSRTSDNDGMDDRQAADSQKIEFRVTLEQREMALRAAEYEGLTLSSFMRRLLVLRLREMGLLGDAN